MKRTQLRLPSAGEPVAKPEGFDVIAWYDLSPMRPDEYARTNARRWTEAVTCRTAFEEGQRDAAREGEASQQQRQGFQA